MRTFIAHFETKICIHHQAFSIQSKLNVWDWIVWFSFLKLSILIRFIWLRIQQQQQKKFEIFKNLKTVLHFQLNAHGIGDESSTHRKGDNVQAAILSFFFKRDIEVRWWWYDCLHHDQNIYIYIYIYILRYKKIILKIASIFQFSMYIA